MKSVILASASPARSAMLANAGVRFETMVPRVDEEEVRRALRADGAAPRDQADALAELKAKRVSARHPGALVLGADQMLSFEGEPFDKPRTSEEALEQLRALRGASHDLLSAAVIAVDGAPVWRHVGRARLTMRAFSDEFLATYVDECGEDLLTTVGGYKIEGRGAQLFSRIDGDFFTILGLPLLNVLDYLRVRGALTT